MSLPSRRFLHPVAWLGKLIGAIIRPRPRTRLWRWLDAHVVVPESSGGPNPGRLRTGRCAIFQGLYDLAEQKHVRFLTLCSSARAGKTLFCICLVLYWIAERFGNVGWLDPTRNSARKFVRDELDDFLLGCDPVRDLAIAPPGKPDSKRWWTTFEKAFRGKRLRILGSGANADMHGFNLELVIGNELDECRASTDSDSASIAKMEARTALFERTRLIVVNSTPHKNEGSPIWHRFKSASQHHCYLPCPLCSDLDKETEWQPPAHEDCEPGRSPLSYDPRLRGWQRLTFFPDADKPRVPFSEDLTPLRDAAGKLLPRHLWREEMTGQASFGKFAIMEERPSLADPTRLEMVRVGWDTKGVREGTTYECAHCKGEIEFADLPWMEARYRWMAHNPQDDDEHISAHVWSFYSPFQSWGTIAAEFLKSKGNLGALIKFWTMLLGKPFLREGSAVKSEDLDRVIARCPVRYMRGQMPFEAEFLNITVDKQGDEYWFAIRAVGVLWDHPDWPTWTALVDWGPASSTKMLLEKCGRIADEQGHARRFKFARPDGEVREYVVTSGLVDCGFEQQAVWDFCMTQSDWLSPSKGGGVHQTGGNLIRLAKVMDEQLEQVWFLSEHFTANLYWDCIKAGADASGPINWWLPTDIDKDYRDQLTDEYRGEKDGKPAWLTKAKNNHLGDCEKNQRVGRDTFEDTLDEIRAERAAEIEAARPKSKA